MDIGESKTTSKIMSDRCFWLATVGETFKSFLFWVLS